MRLALTHEQLTISPQLYFAGIIVWVFYCISVVPCAISLEHWWQEGEPSSDSIDTATPAASRGPCTSSFHSREIESNNVFLKSKKGCLLFSIFNVANKHARRCRCRRCRRCRLFRRSLFIYRFSNCVFAHRMKMASDRLVSVVLVFGINNVFFSDALELECVFIASCFTLFRTFRSHQAII